MLLKPAFALLFLVASCGRCGSGSEGGATPYVRCLAADPPELPSSIGRLKFTVEDRVLKLTGLPSEVRVAVFQGPSMATSVGRAKQTIAKLAASKPDLLLMIGGAGVAPETAPEVIEALSNIGPPVLFVAGGRDSAKSAALAKEALPVALAERFVDVTTFAGIEFGKHLWLIVAGSEGGASSIGDDSCGFTADDLAERRGAATSAKEGTKITLVSWEIPSVGADAAPGTETNGSTSLAELGGELGQVSGLHAWPDLAVTPMLPASAAQAGVVDLVVPRVAGPAHERPDGTRRMPGFVLVRFSDAGLVAETPR